MTRRKPSAPPSVVIIGGGLMGTSSALELRRAGASVTVLEKALPGAEASTAAAGILGAEVENDAPGPMLDLCRLSRSLYPKWVRTLEKESQMSVGFLEGGCLKVSFDKGAASELAKARRFQIQTGKARALGSKELKALEPALNSDASGALFFPDECRVSPDLLYRATYIAAKLSGVTFKSGAQVRTLRTEGAESRVTGVVLTDGTEIRADVTVVAAGSWTNLIEGLPKSRAPVVPARGQIVELESPAPLLSRLVFGAGVYLIPRADGRILIGSTLEFVGYHKAVTARGVHDLLKGALQLVPELATAELRGTWSNFRPYTSDHLPLLGTAGLPGLVMASGHYRNGILLAPITAKVVAALCLGKRPPLALDAFDPRRS